MRETSPDIHPLLVPSYSPSSIGSCDLLVPKFTLKSLSNPTTILTSPTTSQDNIKLPPNPPAYAPPSYESLAKRGSIDAYTNSLFFQSPEEAEYRIEANIPLKSHLPSYSPASYKLCVCAVKFEKTPIAEAFGDNVFPALGLGDPKKWTPVIMELNLTQLRLYRLEISDLQPGGHDMASKIRYDKEMFASDAQFKKEFYDHSYFMDDVLQALDMDSGVLPLDTPMLQFCADYTRQHGRSERRSFLNLRIEPKSHKKSSFLRTLGLSEPPPPPKAPIDSLNNWEILKSVAKNPKKFLSKERLIKLFTLQHARLGLASDFAPSRKDHALLASIFGTDHFTEEGNQANVLRFRLETLQFVANFKYLNELINWFNAVTIGIDVSLDLENRELPKYNNVPSRRRRRRRRRRHKQLRPSISGLRERALSLASELLLRSRRGTVGSDNFEDSRVARLRAKNSPVVNYFLLEFERGPRVRLQSMLAARTRAGLTGLRVTLDLVTGEVSPRRAAEFDMSPILTSSQNILNLLVILGGVASERVNLGDLGRGFRIGDGSQIADGSRVADENLLGGDITRVGEPTTKVEAKLTKKSLIGMSKMSIGLSRIGDRCTDGELLRIGGNEDFRLEEEEDEMEEEEEEEELEVEEEEEDGVLGEEEEEDYEYEEDEYGRSPRTGQLPVFRERIFVPIDTTEGKWEPTDKIPTLRRIVKDLLKSLPLLRASDTWINTKIVRMGAAPKGIREALLGKLKKPEEIKYRYYQVTVGGVCSL